MHVCAHCTQTVPSVTQDRNRFRCMCVHVYVRVHVCMYICMYVCVDLGLCHLSYRKAINFAPSMYECMYLCMSACIYVWACTLCKYAYVCALVLSQEKSLFAVCTRMCVYKCSDAYLHTCIHTYVYKCSMGIYIHTYIHTCIYTCIPGMANTKLHARDRNVVEMTM